MNISHEHKVIWFAPQRCGTKALAHIFSKLGFEYYFNLDAYYSGVSDNYQSHEVVVPEEFSDYKLIISTRNPYDRILSLFYNFTMVGKNLTYTRDTHQDYMSRFELFVKELFYRSSNSDDKPILNNYVLRYSYKTDMSYNVLRMENLIEDLSKIDFVKSSDIWKSGYVHDYLISNQHKIKRPFKFNTIYTPTAAKIVYQNQHKHFIMGEYDPFSFTTEEISNVDKMKFIHENLD